MTTDKRTPAMILPAFEPVDGTVDHRAAWRDERVPAVPFAASWVDEPQWTTPRLLDWANSTYETGQCRHAFDVIESTRTTYEWVDLRALDEIPRDATEDRETVEFRQTLTCTRCGLIRRQSGTFTTDTSGRSSNGSSSRSRIDPTPIAYRTLRAQQVYRTPYAKADGAGVWHVHDQAGAVIGRIDWGRTLRGREYFAGKLEGWADGVHVEGSSPLAVLRKLEAGR